MALGSNLASGREKRVRIAVSSKPSATKRSISGDQLAKAKQGRHKRVVRNKIGKILGIEKPGTKTLILP